MVWSSPERNSTSLWLLAVILLGLIGWVDRAAEEDSASLIVFCQTFLLPDLSRANKMVQAWLSSARPFFCQTFLVVFVISAEVGEEVLPFGLCLCNFNCF